MYFYGDAGTGPCITNLSQDSLLKSARKTLQLFQNEVIRFQLALKKIFREPCSIGIKMYFYGDAGTGPCITNLNQDSPVKSACKTLQLFQNEVIVHFLFSFTTEI
jgi:hypothetical protein